MKKMKSHQVWSRHASWPLSSDLSKLRGPRSLFLRFAFGAAAALLFASCAQKSPVTRTEFALGAPLTIQVLSGPGALETEQAIEAAFENTKRIESLMSTSGKDYTSTELMDINALSRKRFESGETASFEYAVSPDTFAVVGQSLDISEETGGAFDITIEPVVRLWGFGEETQAVPAQDALRRALGFVHWKSLRLAAENRIALEAGQSLDVGGVAKGYAADEAAAILASRGVSSALLDFGGNIRTLGAVKPDGTPWRIGIQNPFGKTGEAVAVITVGETSVVTSGVYERYFEENGTRYFHILDPKTGSPPRNGLMSVSVIGPRGDGFSGGLFVMGLERGLALAEQTQDMEAVFITDNKEIFITSGLEGVFELVSSEYRLSSVGNSAAGSAVNSARDADGAAK